MELVFWRILWKKNCLSHSPLQLQMKSQMRHNLCWLLIKKWGKPHYLAWSATGPCPNRTFHLERQRTLYLECCRPGVATQLLKEFQREAVGLGISSALLLWWQSTVIRILFSDISTYLVKWFKKVYMLFTNTIICTYGVFLSAWSIHSFWGSGKLEGVENDNQS